MLKLLAVVKWCKENWRLLAIASVYGLGMYHGGKIQQHKQDAEKIDSLTAQLEKNQSDNAKLKKLEETKNENLDYVANLYFELGKSKRLRLPECRQPSETGADRSTGERGVSEGVSGGEEEALNEFDTTYRNAALRSDKIVEQCRELNEFND